MTYVNGTNANSIMRTKNHITSHILYVTDVFGSLIRKLMKEKLFLFLICSLSYREYLLSFYSSFVFFLTETKFESNYSF